eukprot:tig00000144_g9173.t1
MIGAISGPAGLGGEDELERRTKREVLTVPQQALWPLGLWRCRPARGSSAAEDSVVDGAAEAERPLRPERARKDAASASLPADQRTVVIGQREVKAIDPHWTREVEIAFAPYLPDQGGKGQLPTGVSRADVLELHIEDVSKLLRCSHSVFWSHVLFNKSCAAFLDTYLRYRRRPFDGEDGADGAAAEDDRTEALEYTLQDRVLRVLLRMSRTEEGPGAFLAPKFWAAAVYDSWALDIPKVLDVCALYGPGRPALVADFCRRLFKQQPAYESDLEEAAGCVAGVLGELRRRCGGGAGLPAGELAEARAYVADIAFSLQQLTKAHPPAAHALLASLPPLAACADALFPPSSPASAPLRRAVVRAAVAACRHAFFERGALAPGAIPECSPCLSVPRELLGEAFAEAVGALHEASPAIASEFGLRAADAIATFDCLTGPERAAVSRLVGGPSGPSSAPAQPSAGPSAGGSGSGSGSGGGSLLESRRNVFAGDEFDVFSRDSVDAARVHTGKWGGDNRAARDEPAPKALVIAAASRIEADEYEDEYDDTMDGYGVAVLDAGEVTEDTAKIVKPAKPGGSKPGARPGVPGEEEEEEEDPFKIRGDVRRLNAKPEARRRPAWEYEEEEEEGEGEEGGEGAPGPASGAAGAGGGGGGEGGEGEQKAEPSLRERAWKDRNKAAVANHHRKDRATAKMMRGLRP